MHNFPLRKQIKIVIALMVFHFIRITARTNMKFKHYDVDKGLLAP